jgi:hypothetical protein
MASKPAPDPRTPDPDIPTFADGQNAPSLREAVASREGPAEAIDDPHPLAAARAADDVPEATTPSSTTAPKGPLIPSGAIEALIVARHADPFSVLGLHRVGDIDVVRAFVPSALAM